MFVRAESQSMPRGVSPLSWNDFAPYIQSLSVLCKALWLFTESDFATLILPNSVFGICAALAPSLGNTQASWIDVVLKIPQVILFNWSTTLIFCIANQRDDGSILEDKVNKPSRPIPSGLISQNYAKGLLVALPPLVFALNLAQGAGIQTLGLFFLTWLYNDTASGNSLARNVIIAIAFGFYNHGSYSIALPTGAQVGQDGWMWILIISGVIVTTMHIQDLKDQEGDRMRGRLTFPILLGDNFARVTISMSVLFWSLASVLLWGVRVADVGLLTCALGAYVAMSCVVKKGKVADKTTWKLWCVWLATLYTLPVWSNAAQTVQAL